MSERASWRRKLAVRSSLVLGGVLLLAVLFLTVLNSALVRTRVASFASQQVTSALQGSLEISHIEGLGWGVLEGARVVVRDEAGEVLRAEGVSARVRMGALLRSLVAGGPVVVDIDDAEIMKAELTLLPTTHPDATLRIQAAFLPAPKAPEEGADEERSTGAPAVVLRIASARLQEVTASYRSPTGETATVQLEALSGKLWLAESFAFDVESARIHGAVPGSSHPFQGDLSARGVVGPKQLRIDLESLSGTVADASLRAEGVYLAPKYYVRAEVDSGALAFGSFGLPESLPAARFDVAAVGDAEALEASVTTDGEAAAFAVHSHVDFKGAAVAQGRISHLDLRTVAPAAPPAIVSGFLEVVVDWEAELSVLARVETHPVVIDTWRAPALSLDGSLDGSLAALTVASRECDCLHAGATFDLDQKVSAGFVDLRLDGADRNLASLLERAQARVVDVELAATGEYDWQQQEFSALVDGKVRGARLASPTVGVGSLDVVGKIRGKVARPDVDLALVVRGLKTPDVSIDRLAVNAAGTPPRLRVRADARSARFGTGLDRVDVTVAGYVNELAPLAFGDVDLRIRRGAEELRGRLGSFVVAPDIRVDNLLLEGPGTLRADVSLSSGGTVQAAVATDAFDLERVSALLAPLVPPLSGRASVIADVRARTDAGGALVVAGHSVGTVHALALPGMEFDALRWSLTSERSLVSGSAHVDLLRDGGAVSLFATDVAVGELARRPLADWPRIHPGTARIELDLSAQELNAVLNVPPPLTLAGRVHAQLELLSRGERANRIELNIETRDLTLHSVEEGEHALERAPSPWEFQGLNARVLASYDYEKHELESWVRLSDRERRRLVTEANIRLAVPPGFPHANVVWETLPIEIDLRFPEAPLVDLPGGYLPSGTAGTIEGGALLRGTLGNPEVQVLFDVEDFSVRSAYQSLPVSFHLDGEYGKNRAEVVALVEHEGRKVLTATFQSDDVDGLLDGARTADYDAGLEIDELPIGCFPYVRDYAVEGSVSARAEVLGSGRGPDGFVRVRAHDLTALEVPFSGVELDAALEPGGVYRGRARVAQSDGEGRVELVGKLPLSGGADTPLGLHSARFAARNLEIAPLGFALRDLLRDLRGRLTGDLRVDLSGSELASRGTLELSQGRAQLVALGQELHDIRARVRALPGGDIEVHDISARARDGRLEGDLEIGYDWGGLRRLEARAVVPNDARYPVVYEGLPLGEVSGTVTLVGTREEQGLAFAIETSELDFYVSEELDLELQSVSPSEVVEIGSKTRDGKFVAYASERSEVEEAAAGPALAIRLGKDVWVHRGQGAFIAVRGELVREPSGKMRGKLELPEGQIDVIGRIFEVDRGIVTFREDDPGNPVVVVEASWESPSGHRITAQYRGPVDDGTLTLSSDPPLTQDQVLNVILFDDPEGGSGEQEGQGAGAASALATTVTTSGLGRALSDLSNLEISAGVDTSEPDNARPELGVRLSPRWSIGVQYNPEGGTDAVSRHPDRALLSIRARISSRWSVESTVGDGGTSILDLMWRYHH